MIQTVRVRNIVGKDFVGEGVLHDIRHTLGNKKVKKVESAKVYRLEGVSEREARLLAEKVFCEDIYQTYTLNAPILEVFHDSKLHPRGVAAQHPGGGRLAQRSLGEVGMDSPGVAKSGKRLEIDIKKYHRRRYLSYRHQRR